MDVTRRTVLGAGLAAVAAGVAGCAASSASGTVIHPEHPPTSPSPTGSTPAATTGAAPTTAGPSAARPLRLVQTPAQERATLASWRSTGDPVLHELRWSGAVAEVDAPAAASRGSSRTPYGCTLFVAAGDLGRVMVGRNFDWDPNPAAVVRSRTDRGPRSIGMCDLSFVELPTAELPRVGEAVVRRRLLRAHGRVVDGMNQHGLFIGLAADLEARSVARPGTIVVGGVGIVRLVLDHAKDVRGALAMFERHSLEFAGGPGLHYLVADRSGASATIELVDGRLSVRERAAATPVAVPRELPAGHDAAGRSRRAPALLPLPRAADRLAGPHRRRRRAPAAGRRAPGRHAVVSGLRPHGRDRRRAPPGGAAAPPLLGVSRGDARISVATTRRPVNAEEPTWKAGKTGILTVVRAG